MAVDEALLESAAASGGACLRFYFWSQPTLSLGYFQRSADRELHAASQACPLVRRATGGGAILHDRELTYSLTAPTCGGRRFDAGALYAAVHEALVDFLRGCEIEATLCTTPAETGREQPFLCFERRAAGDVLLAGAKIAGSAQRRRNGAVLQHGSLLLSKSPQAPELAGVEDLAGRPMNTEELARGWTERLSQCLGLRFTAAEFTPRELQRGKLLQAEKFDATAWRERR